MFLTLHIIKRMSKECGFKKSTRDIKFLQNYIDNYVNILIKNLIELVKYSGTKTIKASDIQVLYMISDKYLHVLAPIGLKNNFKYSHTDPFKKYIKNIITSRSDAIRVSPDVIIILLEMVEQHILNIFKKTRLLFNHSNLLKKDIERVLTII